MSVILGVILAHTGTVALALTHPQTSSRSAQSCPTAASILRSGIPWGHEKLISNASYKTITLFNILRTCGLGKTQTHNTSLLNAVNSSSHPVLLYSSMMEAMRIRSGYSCFSCLNSLSMVSRGRSLMSSMFCHPITSVLAEPVHSLAYRGIRLMTFDASSDTWTIQLQSHTI